MVKFVWIVVIVFSLVLPLLPMPPPEFLHKWVHPKDKQDGQYAQQALNTAVNMYNRKAHIVKKPWTFLLNSQFTAKDSKDQISWIIVAKLAEDTGGKNCKDVRVCCFEILIGKLNHTEKNELNYHSCSPVQKDMMCD